MAHIRQFSAVRFARRGDSDISAQIAPPFDVLDQAAKAALKVKHPHNIVNIDLPHLPPKAAGPAEVYSEANITLQAWLKAGVLARDPKPALYPYAQTFQHNGHTLHRRGFFALVRLSPFGAGQVVPHELTYKGAIEDRLALMRATAMQLSPIFGLYSDPGRQICSFLYGKLSKPDVSATLDGVRNDLWVVSDSQVENCVIDLMASRPIFIADGHHRYTTALAYRNEVEERNGRPLHPNHPANFCLFVLIGLQDDGLLILPTHRLIGGLKSFDAAQFMNAVKANFDVTRTSLTPDKLAAFADEQLPHQPAHTLGLYDGVAKTLYQLHLKNTEVLAKLEPTHSQAWRQLDVAILQRYLLDEVVAPLFASGSELVKSYTSYGRDVAPQVTGDKHQIAFLLQSTPLHTLEDLGLRNEVMPQKSTYFYPKLATGLLLNPLE